jgi:DNA-binding MarR family transcriptional regulator
MEAGDLDPAQRAVLIDLFSEIPVLEHLMRNRLEPEVRRDLSAAEFGKLNYFCRLNRHEDRLSNIALCFEETEEQARSPLAALAARGLFAIDDELDPCVRITEAGRAAHAIAISEMAPGILEIVDGMDPEHLRITAETLREIRRTVANMPPRGL